MLLFVCLPENVLKMMRYVYDFDKIQEKKKNQRLKILNYFIRIIDVEFQLHLFLNNTEFVAESVYVISII